MDANTRSSDRTRKRDGPLRLDGYTVHLLSLDGTIATVRRKRTDGTFQLIVEVRERRGVRTIPADIAADPGSAEFARVVDEVKTELLRNGRARH
jgi:hypothetical protein